MLPFILAVLLLLVPLVIYDIWQRDREFRRCKRSMPFTLKDWADPNHCVATLGQVHGAVGICENNHGLEIMVMGYGDHESLDGLGSPIFLEYYAGRLRLIVHPDINNPEPDIILLEKARESNRKEEAEVN